MSTYLESYANFGQGYDRPRSSLRQEILLLQAWGEFWHDVMVAACPSPDRALVLMTIRDALRCARIHRKTPAADQTASASALAYAIQVQTETVLRWCDDRGLTPPVEMIYISQATDSQATHSQETLVPRGHSMPESSAF